MPTNLYGPNDNYHPTHSHVLPALIRRFHEAKEAGLESVTCWGDGTPLREFLYVDDLADLCGFLLNNYSGNETVNAGTGKELTIKELTELVAKVVDYKGKTYYCRPNLGAYWLTFFNVKGKTYFAYLDGSLAKNESFWILWHKYTFDKNGVLVKNR